MKSKTYKMFGWHEKKDWSGKDKDEVCFIYPNVGAVRMCFGSPVEALIKRGDGEIVELEIKIKKVVKI